MYTDLQNVIHLLKRCSLHKYLFIWMTSFELTLNFKYYTALIWLFCGQHLHPSCARISLIVKKGHCPLIHI